MRICPFKEGDLVRVKTLEQLRSQYREIPGSGFAMPVSGFNVAMYKLCGVEFHISEVRVVNVGACDVFYFISEEGIEKEESRPFGIWCITEYMVELVELAEHEPHADPEISKDDWLQLLS